MMGKHIRSVTVWQNSKNKLLVSLFCLDKPLWLVQLGFIWTGAAFGASNVRSIMLDVPLTVPETAGGEKEWGEGR